MISQLDLMERDSKNMKKHVEELNKRKFWQFDLTKRKVKFYIKKYRKYINKASI